MMQLMILVDDVGSAFPSLNHSPWFGVTLADFVMPFFLFGVGVSIALVFKVLRSDGLTFNILCSACLSYILYSVIILFTFRMYTLTFQKLSNKPSATKKVMLRTIKLFLLGILLQGMFFCFIAISSPLLCNHMKLYIQNSSLFFWASCYPQWTKSRICIY